MAAPGYLRNPQRSRALVMRGRRDLGMGLLACGTGIVVVDAPPILHAVSIMLRYEGYIADTAANGRDAIASARQAPRH